VSASPARPGRGASIPIPHHQGRRAPAAGQDPEEVVIGVYAGRRSHGRRGPVLDSSAPLICPHRWLVQAFLLEAIARDKLGDQIAAGRALEHALDLAEPDGALLWFLLHPAPDLLERQARQRTAHAALIADILSLLAGRKLAPPPAGPRPPLEPLSDSEIRVLRYLPTNLTGPEVAGELHVSPNTVRTHMRHLYEKLGTHTRAEAVARARALGLLAPSPHRGQATRPG
jgi:LuxR family transcriptional regulator, maltose regulon positive regulatory protein